MRKFGKIDSNQKEIVKQLRQLGYSVVSTASLGDGFPDLIVGKRNTNWLFEVKDGAKKYASEKKLTNLEENFFKNWQGQVSKVESLDEILKVINGK